jgi:tRNA/rRNA methyltransferase
MYNVSVVLVEPQGPINVGSVCRSMMNFGLGDLRLVNPCAAYDGLAARKMALKAAAILKNATVWSTLESALADCRVSFGTTRRYGKYREAFVDPEQAAGLALSQPADRRIAFVFGREDRGLHTSELDLCQHFITIATHEGYPSMNLAQAVAVTLYELRKASLAAVPAETSRRASATLQDIERMFQHMRRTLLAVDYLDPQNPDHVLRTFRRLFGRAGLDDREVRILQGLWSRIDWIDGERRKLQKSKP